MTYPPPGPAEWVLEIDETELRGPYTEPDARSVAAKLLLNTPAEYGSSKRRVHSVKVRRLFAPTWNQRPVDVRTFERVGDRSTS